MCTSKACCMCMFVLDSKPILELSREFLATLSGGSTGAVVLTVFFVPAEYAPADPYEVTLTVTISQAKIAVNIIPLQVWRRWDRKVYDWENILHGCLIKILGSTVLFDGSPEAFIRVKHILSSTRCHPAHSGRAVKLQRLFYMNCVQIVWFCKHLCGGYRTLWDMYATINNFAFSHFWGACYTAHGIWIRQKGVLMYIQIMSAACL